MDNREPEPMQKEEAQVLLDIGDDVTQEVIRARSMYPKFSCLHEALAVLWEEFEELKLEVFKKNASPDKLHDEAIQVAAMAVRLIQDCCIKGEEKGDDKSN
jgi:hypothetical protein